MWEQQLVVIVRRHFEAAYQKGGLEECFDLIFDRALRDEIKATPWFAEAEDKDSVWREVENTIDYLHNMEYIPMERQVELQKQYEYRQ